MKVQKLFLTKMASILIKSFIFFILFINIVFITSSNHSDNLSHQKEC